MNAIYKFVMAQLAKGAAKRTGIATISRATDLNVELSVKQIARTLEKMGVDVSKITNPKEVEKLLDIQASWLKQTPKKSKPPADVHDLSGKKIDTSKPILGGKNVPETEAQIKSKLEGMNKKTVDRIRRKRYEAALKAEREKMAKDPDYLPKVLDPEDFAYGGIAGMLGEPTYADEDHRVPYEKAGKVDLSAILKGILPEKEPPQLRKDFTGQAGPSIGRPPKEGIESISSGAIKENTSNLLRTMLYIAKNSEKKKQASIYSALDGGIELSITNNATGLETDLATKLVAGKLDINEGVPTRIDENTVFDITIDTFNKLPADLQAEIKASTNLAKDESWSALLEGTNLGIAYNSDNQKIEGYYDVNIDSETYLPTKITPKFEKNNITNENIASLFIGQGDFPPQRSDFPEGQQGAMMFQQSLQAWEKNESKKYWGIDLKSRPTSDYEGIRGTFTTENVSGWSAIERGDDTDVTKTQITSTIPNYLLKDQKPIELSGSYYQDLDTDDKETKMRVDVPFPMGITPYYGKKVGDWSNATEYGINLDKSGELGNWDYNIIGNIDQDKDYRIQADIGTDNIGIGGWYDAYGNWHAGITASWKWGEPEEKKYKSFTTSDPEEAWNYSKKKLFAGGGLAGMLGEPTYADGGRVPLGSGKFVFDAARRKFLQLLGAGAAGTVAAKSGLLGLLKGGGKKTVIKDLTSVPIKKIEGMPSWFKPLVNQIIKKGNQVESGAERVIVHKSKLPNSKTDIYVEQSLDTGDVAVQIGSGKHGWSSGHHGQPVSLQYTAPQHYPTHTEAAKIGAYRKPTGEVDDVGLFKGTQDLSSKKTKPEFWVEEAEFTGGHPENIKFEESSFEKFGEHGSNFDEVEMFATGKVKKKKPLKKSGWGDEGDHNPDLDMASGGRVPLADGKKVADPGYFMFQEPDEDRPSRYEYDPNDPEKMKRVRKRMEEAKEELIRRGLLERKVFSETDRMPTENLFLESIQNFPYEHTPEEYEEYEKVLRSKQEVKEGGRVPLKKGKVPKGPNEWLEILDIDWDDMDPDEWVGILRSLGVKGHATGGRVPLGKGKLVKGLGELAQKLAKEKARTKRISGNLRFENQKRTNIGKPKLSEDEYNYYRELLDDEENYFVMGDETKEMLEAMVKEADAEMNYMHRLYKKGALDPTPGEQTRGRLKMLEDKAQSGVVMTTEEIKELKILSDMRDRLALGGRVPLAGGAIVKGGKWFIKSLTDTRKQLKTMRLSPGQLKQYLDQIDDQIRRIKAGEKIPDEIIQTIRKDPKFKSVWQNQKSADPELREMEEVLLEYGQKHASGGLAGMLGE